MRLQYLINCVLLAVATGVWGRDTAIQQHEWHSLGRAAPDEQIGLHIALKPASPRQDIDEIAINIATPEHPSFRKHLSAMQASSLSDPTIEGSTAVEDWLRSHDIQGRLRGGIFEASVTVAEAERLLGAEYHWYEHQGRSLLSTDTLDLPKEILEHIEFITPTVQWPSLVSQPVDADPGHHLSRRQSSASRLDGRSNCGSNDQVTPSCLKQVYNITYTPKPDRTTFGVYGTEAASLSNTDLEIFLLEHNFPAALAHPSYQIVGSGDASEDANIGALFETALDTQTFLGLAWPAQGIFYNNGGVFGPNATSGQTYDRFVSFLQDLIHNETVPSVVSFSESMPEDMLDPAYARRLCSMMAQVGARGVSLVFSSGDNGPNGDQPSGVHKRVFETEFPASCPYVTSVGGTVDLANEVGATKSTLANGGFGDLGFTSSGGGFSTLFQRPDYQQGIVDKYIEEYVPENYTSISGYNAAGRGVPDVSAFSSNIPVVVLRVDH